MVRNYTTAAVDPAAVDRIVAAALTAPSAGNTRAQNLIVVTDPPTRAAIALLAGEIEHVAGGLNPWLSRAPVHIIPITSEEAYHRRYLAADKLGPHESIDWPIPYWWIDIGATFMTILLAAVAEDLAAGFLGAHAIPGLGNVLGLSAEMRAIGVVTVGHPAPDRRSHSLDRPLGESRVRHIR